MSVIPPERRTPDLPDPLHSLWHALAPAEREALVAAVAERFRGEPDDASGVVTVNQRNSIVYIERRVTIVDTTLEKTVSRPNSGHHTPLPAAPLNCSIFCTDIAGFGDPRRDDDDRRVIRAALYQILRDVFEASKLPWEMCVHEDRGDGTLTVVPPTIPTGPLVDPLIPMLASRLKRYNRQAGDPVRIQLRAALHVGPVAPDTDGLRGHALIQAARMLDAPALKEALAAADADLAFIASGHVYDTVIRHATGLVDPAAFRRIRVNVKESKTTSWMYIAGTA
jgi:hypothetical protein